MCLQLRPKILFKDRVCLQWVMSVDVSFMMWTLVSCWKVGDLPDADIKPPENVLFVCKLNPVTTDEDLEIIFSRFGPIKWWDDRKCSRCITSSDSLALVVVVKPCGWWLGLFTVLHNSPSKAAEPVTKTNKETYLKRKTLEREPGQSSLLTQSQHRHQFKLMSF